MERSTTTAGSCVVTPGGTTRLLGSGCTLKIVILLCIFIVREIAHLIGLKELVLFITQYNKMIGDVDKYSTNIFSNYTKS